MKNKSKIVSIITLVVGLLMGGQNVLFALTVEACQALGFICGNCNNIVEVNCTFGPTYPSSCNGHPAVADVFDVTGSHVGLLQNQGVGHPCWAAWTRAECVVWYETFCNGQMVVGADSWYELNFSLCGDPCYVG